jgi:DNA gyrase inhibitor GyrI
VCYYVHVFTLLQQHIRYQTRIVAVYPVYLTPQATQHTHYIEMFGVHSVVLVTIYSTETPSTQYTVQRHRPHNIQYRDTVHTIYSTETPSAQYTVQRHRLHNIQYRDTVHTIYSTETPSTQYTVQRHRLHNCVFY